MTSTGALFASTSAAGDGGRCRDARGIIDVEMIRARITPSLQLLRDVVGRCR
jgi:hypothetical protein